MKRFLSALILSVCCISTIFAQDANSQTAQDEDPPYYIVEQMPKFLGGDIGEFIRWKNKLIMYPIDAMINGIEGQVVMKFVVERDGTLSSFEAISSPDQLLTDEAIRVLKMSPEWEPGMHEGKPVRVGLSVPFKFMVIDSTKPNYKDREIFAGKADQMPTFQGGGLDTFQNWVQSKLAYPDKANNVQGKVTVRFVIEDNGSVSKSNIDVLASPDQSLSDEAIRVVSKSPKWKPGIKDGKRVRTYFIMSVLFGPQGDSPSTEVIAQESLQQEITDMPVADTTSSNEQINGSVIYWLKYEDRELSLADLNALNPDNIESSNIVIAPGEIKMYTSRVKRDSADAVIEIKTKKYAPEYDILYWFLDENREITPDELKTYDANSLKTFKVIDDDDDDDDYSERLRQIIGDRKFAGVSIIGSNDLKNSEDALEELGYRMPKFMGGDLEKFRNRLMDKIVYPRLALERNIQGKVVIKFVVEKDGSIGDIKELSSPDPLLTEKTVRVLKSSPKWSPGTIDDKPVRVAYVLPIIFRL